MVDMTIGRLWGSRVWVILLISLYWKNFFLNLYGVKIVFPQYNGLRFFSALYAMSDIFFSAEYFTPRNLLVCFFPLEISLQDIFSDITHNLLKSQMFGP